MLVAEVKGKEELYQNIIREKDQIIQEKEQTIYELKEKTQEYTQHLHSITKSTKRQRIQHNEDESIDSETYHQMKFELREKEMQCGLHFK